MCMQLKAILQRVYDNFNNLQQHGGPSSALRRGYQRSYLVRLEENSIMLHTCYIHVLLVTEYVIHHVPITYAQSVVRPHVLIVLSAFFLGMAFRYGESSTEDRNMLVSNAVPSNTRKRICFWAKIFKEYRF